ncbi:MAG: hypothetical protein DRN90_00285 [Thermoproteota archaeon]|nr:MAG: hypothetical protein DRN90_00285 [Candidatus Korarchaeota archaeon]
MESNFNFSLFSILGESMKYLGVFISKNRLAILADSLSTAKNLAKLLEKRYGVRVQLKASYLCG